MGKSLKGKSLGKGITQRKDGLYQGRFIDRFGKRRTIYAKSYLEITQKLRAEQYEDEKNINIKDCNVTFENWFNTWIVTYKTNLRNSTSELYKRRFQWSPDYIRESKLKDLNMTSLQQALNSLENDYRRRVLKSLWVSVLDKAVSADMIMKNYARGLNTEVSGDQPEEKRPLSKEEEELFINSSYGTQYHNLFIVALETGMRVSELCGLEWSDVDMENRIIHVNKTLVHFSMDHHTVFEWHKPKTNTGIRIIPFGTQCYQALKQQQLLKRCIENKGYTASDEYKNLVFVTNRNTPVNEVNVYHSIKKIVTFINKKNTEARFEMFSPHTLRHTFATRRVEDGMDPKTLQKLMGHKHLSITMDTYYHKTDDLLIQEVKEYELQKQKCENGVKVV